MMQQMAVFLRIDINVVAMILLGIVIFIAKMRLDKHDNVNKTFLNVSMIIILQLFLETTTCFINKRPELWLVPVSVAFHICLFITGPVLAYFWFVFIRSMVTRSDVSSKWRILLFVPVIVNTVMTLLSPMYRLLFFITSDNVYHRGALFIVSAAMVYIYLILGIMLIIKNRRKIVRQDFLPFLVLGILPTAGGIIQSFFYGALLMWSCSAFSLILVYIFLEERMIHLDYLTGAWSRHSFDHFISQRIKQNSSEKLGIIYIDIDELKNINDKYGHAEGDAALKTVIRIIKSIIRKGDIVARLGGDEFAVILNFENGSREMLENTIKRIDAAFTEHNLDTGQPYTLKCSYGADIFSPESCSIEEFMHGIDTMMYNSKKLKRLDIS